MPNLAFAEDFAIKRGAQLRGDIRPSKLNQLQPYIAANYLSNRYRYIHFLVELILIALEAAGIPKTIYRQLTWCVLAKVERLFSPLLYLFRQSLLNQGQCYNSHEQLMPT